MQRGGGAANSSGRDAVCLERRDDVFQRVVVGMVQHAVDVVVVGLHAQLRGAGAQRVVHFVTGGGNISETAASGQLAHAGRLLSS